ncbi:hypothetical protein L484_005933 [Morus notabilis]|uniref:Embryo sac development arrest 6 n=1 Tax=Morus notabilis TaxID=981085 RepID=W9QSJ7_9ROSA|nr:uncharacterized protein LOC21389383 [Morus notabilis]EXB53503.1 hypothetical protein L484_005933 [Morus notabilis]
MSTKTMRLPPRRVLTPSNKRKEEEDTGVDAVQVPPSTTKKLKTAQPQAEPHNEPAAAYSNQLLAGYLAHEFLNKGTLFGQPFDAARAESSAGSAQEPKQRREDEAERRDGAEPRFESLQRYVAVADLLGSDGAHLAGVFNPTQLARFLQL